MDIRKLGLASTIAILSTTISLGGCDLLGRDQEKIKRLNKLIESKDQRIENRENDIKSLNETILSKNKVITEVKERYNSLMAERNAIVNDTAEEKAEADERQERLKHDAEVARLKLEEEHKRSAEVEHQRVVEEKKYKEKIKRIIDNSVPMSKYNDLMRDRNDIVKKYNNRIAKEEQEEEQERPVDTGYRFPEGHQPYKAPPRSRIALAYAYDNDGNLHEVEQVIPE